MQQVRVSSRPYFTGITSRLVLLQIQHKFLQLRKRNGIWQQRTLKNKQFNIHNKTGMKKNEKYNVRVAFVGKSYGQLNENKIVHTCVCVCLNVNRVF